MFVALNFPPLVFCVAVFFFSPFRLSHLFSRCCRSLLSSLSSPGALFPIHCIWMAWLVVHIFDKTYENHINIKAIRSSGTDGKNRIQHTIIKHKLICPRSSVQKSTLAATLDGIVNRASRTTYVFHSHLCLECIIPLFFRPSPAAWANIQIILIFVHFFHSSLLVKSQICSQHGSDNCSDRANNGNVRWRYGQINKTAQIRWNRV